MHFGSPSARRAPTDKRRLVRQVYQPQREDWDYDIIANNKATQPVPGRRVHQDRNFETEEQPFRSGKRPIQVPPSPTEREFQPAEMLASDRMRYSKRYQDSGNILAAPEPRQEGGSPSHRGKLTFDKCYSPHGNIIAPPPQEQSPVTRGIHPVKARQQSGAIPFATDYEKPVEQPIQYSRGANWSPPSGKAPSVSSATSSSPSHQNHFHHSDILLGGEMHRVPH
eukprot:TRINITY_DN112408_c0_g1_i1.p1 TRINITY_DN112408_c0_g1~~TRINITY_DN112408_c0_g1_i1.p1  ORF type:complete len:224 (-),score=20.45 TRINITY_DN112408_c0_g1_i1:94-765(-)